jgi:hypothetical protein
MFNHLRIALPMIDGTDGAAGFGALQAFRTDAALETPARFREYLLFRESESDFMEVMYPLRRLTFRHFPPFLARDIR